jgi:prepilin-type processing-associated H-X9-DG protein
MRRSRHRAFTLTELLVIMGIIGVLVSILMPAISKARDQSVSTKCLSNVRQIASGLNVYANRHRGQYPPALYLGADPTQPFYNYVGLLVEFDCGSAPAQPDATSAFSAGESVFRCPAGEDAAGSHGNPTDAGPAGFWRVTSPKGNTYDTWYGVNASGSDNNGPFPMKRIPVPSTGRKLTSIDQIKSAADTVLVYDGYEIHDGRINLSARHAGQTAINIGFVDGHGEKFEITSWPTSYSSLMAMRYPKWHIKD